MAEPCPDCGSTDSVLTVRQAFEGEVGPFAGQLAPPPAPPEPAQSRRGWTPSARLRAAIVGGYAGLLVLTVVVGSLAGVGALGLLRFVPLPGLAGLVVIIRLMRTPDADPEPVANLRLRVWQRGIWTRQMQVWEHARLCKDCQGAFWPGGVLRPDFPASPLFPLEQFPVMVATMADRAYGTAQPTIHH